MRLKELEGLLHPLKGFESPKVELEQYVTSAHLASHMIFTAASSFSDIEDRHVLDLGCGCGILSIASAIMGAASVVGVDLDEDALEVARANVEEAEAGEEVDLIRCDIAALAGDAPFRSRGDVFDTVVMNPPFGTKTKGIDMVFLEKGCQIAKHAVYSLHKSSTRDHIERRAKAFGFKGQVLAEMRYDLPKTMKMHKQKSLDIQVDFWRFERI